MIIGRFKSAVLESISGAIAPYCTAVQKIAYPVIKYFLM
jgi:hypothetical protein